MAIQGTLDATGINGVALTLATSGKWYRVRTTWNQFALFNKSGTTVHFRQTLPEGTADDTNDTQETPTGATTPCAIPSGSVEFFLRGSETDAEVKLTPAVS